MNNNIHINHKNHEEEILRLNLENYIWVCFIIASLLNINGNDNAIKYFETKDIKYKIAADKSYLTSVSISTALYVYFVNRNYQFLKHAIEKNTNTSMEELRYIGSVLILLGSSFIWYYQSNTSTLQGSPV